MTPAPVGIRCPDHAGKQRAVRAPRIVARPAGDAIVTRTLVAINVGIYLLTLVQGSGGLSGPGGRLFTDWVLYGPAVAHGDWWRLGTSMFLHWSITHIAFNMIALWSIGSLVEQYLGHTRFLALYLVSGLAGSAGALIQTPNGFVAGASGAVFGILGAMLVLEWNLTGSFAGQAMTWIVINLVISFVIPGISWGGHVGGLIGGILITLAYGRWGRGHAAYGKLGAAGILGLVVVAVGSVVVAYLKVRNLA
jgi:membrane associated rhomboid family serine protease